MRIILFLMIFLLLIPVVMAQNITIPNITIRIPALNQTRLFNLTFFNQSRIADVIEVFSANIYEIIKERVNRAVDYLLNRIFENITKTITESIPNMIEILLFGNSTQY